MATAKSLMRSPFASLSSSFMFKSSPPPLPRRLHRLRVCCSSIQKTLTEIDSSGVIACLRANSAELAFEAACAALEGGISVLEIVMLTPGVFEVLQQLVHIYPTRVLGVGTVLNIEDAERAVTAGAKFFMSPAIVKDIMDDFRYGDVLYIPGVMTPTEILSAYDAGAKIVKIYPVSALGGIHYISAIKKPFPHISMVASQGITIGSVGEYIAKGASSVVLSDAIFDKEAMGQKNFNRIHQLANMAALQCKEAVDRKKNLMLNNL
ncbi:KHG/KDPG aldolase [Rosa sericea]